MQDTEEKIKVGISIGDLNGIGGEVALKTFEDPRMLDFCTPVIFASNKTITSLKNQFDLRLKFHGIPDAAQALEGKVKQDAGIVAAFHRNGDLIVPTWGPKADKIGFPIRFFDPLLVLELMTDVDRLDDDADGDRRAGLVVQVRPAHQQGVGARLERQLEVPLAPLPLGNSAEQTAMAGLLEPGARSLERVDEPGLWWLVDVDPPLQGRRWSLQPQVELAHHHALEMRDHIRGSESPRRGR